MSTRRRSRGLPTGPLLVVLLVAIVAATLAARLFAGGSGPAGSSGTSGSSGSCAIGSLPTQAEATVEEIEAGPPYPYAQDGGTFDNREHLLPNAALGYYREFTVVTPGSPDRGTRRVIAAGGTGTHPADLYYTGNHYASFCHVTGVP